MSLTLNAQIKPSSSSMSQRKIGKVLFRLAISFGLLLIIYSTLDINTLFQAIKSFSPYAAIAVVLLYALGQTISAFKWRIFIETVGINRSMGQVIRSYYFGMYLNTFGLGTIGGDLARGLALRPAKGQRAAALATVVSDRIHGLAVLLSIGTIAIVCFHPASLGIIFLTISILALLGLIAAWIFGPQLIIKIFPKGHKYAQSALNSAYAFPHKAGPLLLATVISIIFHSIQIFMHLIIARAFGAPLSLSFLFAAVPMVNIAASLPISINGLGVREAMYVFLFTPLGVSIETSVAFGTIWIFSTSLVSAMGSVVLPPELRSIAKISESEQLTESY